MVTNKIYKEEWRIKDRVRAKKRYYEKTISIEEQLLKAAKNRAQKQNLEINITIDDIIIPEVCPIFGTSFIQFSWHAASLDRVDNTLGYVKGNVAVISRAANSLKSNGSPEVFQKILNYIKSHSST